jgi:hypothetical protein
MVNATRRLNTVCDASWGDLRFIFLRGLRAAPGSEAIILCFQKVDTQAKTGR